MTDTEIMIAAAVYSLLCMVGAVIAQLDDSPVHRLWDAIVIVVRWPFDRLSMIATRLVRRRSEKNT